MANVIVTGDKELDARLKGLPDKLQNKFTKGAFKKAGIRLLSEFQKIVKAEAYDTGAYHEAATIKPAKRKRSQRGIGLYVDAEKLARHGEPKQYYYPASLEFGYKRQNGTHVPAIKPQRRALYEHENEYRQAFIEDVHQLINQS